MRLSRKKRKCLGTIDLAYWAASLVGGLVITHADIDCTSHLPGRRARRRARIKRGIARKHRAGRYMIERGAAR